jgi:hypothetical protein
MSALDSSYLWRPAPEPNLKIQSRPLTAAREAAEATRETNSAQETRKGLWAPPKAEDHGRNARDRAKQNRPI